MALCISAAGISVIASSKLRDPKEMASNTLARKLSTFPNPLPPGWFDSHVVQITRMKLRDAFLRTMAASASDLGLRWPPSRPGVSTRDVIPY